MGCGCRHNGGKDNPNMRVVGGSGTAPQDQDFQIAGFNGYLVVVLALVFISVVFNSSQKR